MKSPAVWLSPLAGALAVSTFLTSRALVAPDRVDVWFAFLVWFIERVGVGYACVLPLLGIAHLVGLRHIAGYMLIASLAAIPLEHYVSVPINAWHPTEEELDHGFYWTAFLPALLLTSATGAMFAWGVSPPKMLNQSLDPTPTPGMPPAGQESRHG